MGRTPEIRETTYVPKRGQKTVTHGQLSELNLSGFLFFLFFAPGSENKSKSLHHLQSGLQKPGKSDTGSPSK